MFPTRKNRESCKASHVHKLPAELLARLRRGEDLHLVVEFVPQDAAGRRMVRPVTARIGVKDGH